MSDHTAADIDRHVRIYITVFVALLALPVVTHSNGFWIHE